MQLINNQIITKDNLNVGFKVSIQKSILIIFEKFIQNYFANRKLKYTISFNKTTHIKIDHIHTKYYPQ